MNGIEKASIVVWAGLGVVIEKLQESTESLMVYISVPERSYHRDAKDEEMSGMHLAKRFSDVLKEMGLKHILVKARIRKGESWTEAMCNNAERKMKKEVYGWY